MKVILIDWGVIVHKAIFAWKNNPNIPSAYTGLNMVVGYLKRIGVDPDDRVIIAIDAKNNWRKKYDSNYKANRKENRERHEDIDWKEHFTSFNRLVDNLKIATPFHPIKIDTLEADDIIAYATRYFKDNECIIVSHDKDYEQLCIFDNVKIFSPTTKKYKEVKNPELILAKKIKKEASDNLITPIVTEEDYEIRKMIVDLTSLPEFVEVLVKKELDKIEDKYFDLERLWFKSIRNRFMDIYNSKDVIDYKKQIAKSNKKKVKTKAKNKEVKSELSQAKLF